MAGHASLIAETERGHRRGVVLGLTMAELMLLLLFCLLLVSVAALTKKNEEIAAREVDIKVLQSQVAMPDIDLPSVLLANERLADLLVRLFPGGVPPLPDAKVDELWRELELAKNHLDALHEADVDVTQENSSQLAEVTANVVAAAESDATRLDMLLDLLEQLKRVSFRSDVLEQIGSDLSAVLETGILPGHQWPPIINLDSSRYKFEVGSAAVTPEFRQSLQTEITPLIQELLAEYQVDVIEIIGHTDEQRITPRPGDLSNLDDYAIPAMWGTFESENLKAIDNAGLGLARAVAVASILKSTGNFDAVKFVPMSAAQLVAPGDVLSIGHPGDDGARRRIEIRVRRTTAASQ